MQDSDLSAVERQIGRTPRGVRDVSYRCPCGEPAVVTTAPRLDDGTPFPTTYYVTCPRLTSAIGTLEGDGGMREMEERLADHAAVVYHQNAMTTKEALKAYDMNRVSVRDAHKKRLRFDR